MSLLSFEEVKIYDDATSVRDIMKSVIKKENQEEPFYILDLDDLVKKHRDWVRKMPRIVPHYAVKVNPDETVIKVLAALNGCFDCASEQEIRQVMKLGVSPDRIIFANPAKYLSHIRFARKVGVRKMTADSEVELLKIKKFFPEAEIVLRFRCDAEFTEAHLGLKFGCEPDDAIDLMQFMKNLGLNLHGFSFHVGSPCKEIYAYQRGVKISKRLLAIAEQMGFKDVTLIDIGGGIPGESGETLDELAELLNEEIKDIDRSIRIISEPGRYYVTSAFNLAANLHTKKIVNRDDTTMRMYYVNCGVYNSFIEELLDLKARVPTSLYKPGKNEEKYLSTIWGPTCDSFDCIVKNVLLPDYDLDDWLLWTNMGSYTIALSCSFNGFLPPVIIPISRKSQWESFCREVKQIKNSMNFNNGYQEEINCA
ncbi:ornithine decarboxylase 2-like [Prorops nasuta]|uniref:ornithine decarboxylase 2-like n=1 Tax=Prorops nasuta TaxID=863751 RepID=UPI0034CE4D32